MHHYISDINSTVTTYHVNPALIRGRPAVVHRLCICQVFAHQAQIGRRKRPLFRTSVVDASLSRCRAILERFLHGNPPTRFDGVS